MASVTPSASSELDLGDGRRLTITHDAIEVTAPVAVPPGDAPNRVALNTVRIVALEHHRTRAPLLLSVVGLVALLVVPWWPARILALLVVASGVFLYSRTRRFVVRVDRTEGQPARIVLGGGAFGSRRGVRAQSLWAEFSAELKRRGVPVASTPQG